MDNSVLEVLLKTFETLTPTERKPARILLDNFPMAGLETVAQFAKAANVSGPTILRLVGKLGFKGYAEFQDNLRQELKARLESPIQKTGKANARQDSTEEFIDRFGSAVCRNIKRTLSNVPSSEINDIVHLLSNDKQAVYLLGGRYTDIMARHFFLHLHAIRKNVRHVDGQSSVWADSLMDIAKGDAVIIFDIRRYQIDVTDFAKEARQRGAKIILFTDQWFSPVTQVADQVFSARIQVPSNWDSSAAILAIIDLILAKLTKDLWIDVKDRLETRETIFKGFF